LKGIIRTIDRLGRIVIPKSFRDVLNWNTDDDIEITLCEEGLYLRKRTKFARCAMTGEIADDLKVYGNGILLSNKGKKLLLEVLENELDQ